MILKNNENIMYQISSLQALMRGYTKNVMTAGELATHGDTGIGTFVGVAGELIAVDGKVYCAASDGPCSEVEPEAGIPFASVSKLAADREFDLENIDTMKDLWDVLNVKIEESFGLNSMHVIRIDGEFSLVRARSATGIVAQHVELSDIMAETQNVFEFTDIEGTLVCLYHPDFMDGINAPGWHLHFISADRTLGGHVLDLALKQGHAILEKINRIEIQFPTDAAFDTYSLKGISNEDIAAVEQ